jgi:hypothetical protein
MRTKLLFVFLLLGAFLCFTQSASADTVSFDLFVEISGAQSPEGPFPWASITFDDDTGDSSTVEVEFNTFGLIEAEKIKTWVFNFDDSLDETKLTFAKVSADDVNIADTDVGITVSENGISADGVHGFDIKFEFPAGAVADQSPPNLADGIFGAMETVVWEITSTQDINAASFDFLVAGTYPSAAHVLGIDAPGFEEDGGSGWISTPIPGSVLLLAPGLILLGAIRRKFRF